MKQRRTSEKLEALKEMKRQAGKYYPELLPLIRAEIQREYDRITSENYLKARIDFLKNLTRK